MTRETYGLLNEYMQSQMDDAAHDREHIYRVLYNAVDIVSYEKGVDLDVLVAACLLHDVGRREQFADPKVCHAEVGAEKAYDFLMGHGFTEGFAAHVRDCVLTHRFRKARPPESLEAKILFDADKLDAVGTMGIARTLNYKGQVGDPLYNMGPDGIPSDGTGDTVNSFFHEYKFKMERLYDGFYTKRGRELAATRKKAAEEFYKALLEECREPYIVGRPVLDEMLNGEGQRGRET